MYAKGQIREAHAEAQVTHLLALDSEHRNGPMVTIRKVAAAKRLSGLKNPEEEDQLLQFLDGVAPLANRGYLADQDVYDRFGYDILTVYADDEQSIQDERKYDPTNFSNLVLLVPRLEAIDKAEHGTLAGPTADDITEYWNEQAAIGPGALRSHKPKK